MHASAFGFICLLVFATSYWCSPLPTGVRHFQRRSRLAAQQADGRLQSSGATLAGIMAFCGFSVACAVSSTWSELGRH
jgi:hypothetical protein